MFIFILYIILNQSHYVRLVIRFQRLARTGLILSDGGDKLPISPLGL